MARGMRALPSDDEEVRRALELRTQCRKDVLQLGQEAGTDPDNIYHMKSGRINVNQKVAKVLGFEMYVGYRAIEVPLPEFYLDEAWANIKTAK